MFNLKTIGKFNGSKFDKLTSHPAIEEPCYMKFRKVICATYYLRRSLKRFCNSVLVTFLNRNDPHSLGPIQDKNVVIAYMPVDIPVVDDRPCILYQYNTYARLYDIWYGVFVLKVQLNVKKV